MQIFVLNLAWDMGYKMDGKTLQNRDLFVCGKR